MSKSIFLFVFLLFFIKVFSQENTSLEKEFKVNTPFNTYLNFSKKDSSLIDSIEFLIFQSEKLRQTINSLSVDEYSKNAIRYSFRKYTEHLNSLSESSILFLTHIGMKEGLFIPMTHLQTYYSGEQVTAMESFSLRLNVANEILRRKFLFDCEYLDFSEIPYYFDLGIKIYGEEQEKSIYYEGIGSVLALKAQEIKELMSTNDECLTKNVNILLKYSVSFKRAYDAD